MHNTLLTFISSSSPLLPPPSWKTFLHHYCNPCSVLFLKTASLSSMLSTERKFSCFLFMKISFQLYTNYFVIRNVLLKDIVPCLRNVNIKENSNAHVQFVSFLQALTGGLYLAVLWDYSWLCVQGSLMVVISEKYQVLEIE